MPESITSKQAKSLGAIGFICWLLFAATKLPVSPFQINYVQILILAVPTFLLPFCGFLLRFSKKSLIIGLLTSLLLLVSFVMEKSALAAVLSIPWLLWTIWMALTEFQKWFKNKTFQIAPLNLLAASLFLPVGAAWAFADRLDFRPMDFDATITLLTAAHFHYAGFILPLLTGLILQKIQNIWAKMAGIGVIIGVPLVAVGITTSHYLLPEFIETACVTILASSAFIIAFLHLALAFKIKKKTSWLFVLSGFALMTGMLLAMGYGWRYYFPISFLSIPWMYAVHGTLNALGFALPGIVGWFLKVKQR
mgnify:CR=1 FL=1